jgi:hypothetical protein
MTSRCAVGVVSDKYRFGDVGALLNRPKWLRFKPALTYVKSGKTEPAVESTISQSVSKVVNATCSSTVCG